MTKSTSFPLIPLLLGILGIVFITLKLCQVINWSWWYVSSPFWGPFALYLVVILPIEYRFYKKARKYHAEKYKNVPKSRYAQRLEDAMEAQRKGSKS